MRVRRPVVSGGTEVRSGATARDGAATHRPILALYDGTGAAVTTVHRAVTCGAHVVVVGPPGAERAVRSRIGDLADRVATWTPVRRPTLDAALAAAREHAAPWLCVPSTLLATEDLLETALRGVAELLGPARPGVVLHVVRPAGPVAGPLPYRRVAAVSDLDDSSGTAAYVAGAVAARAGAELEALLLGCDVPVRNADDLAAAMSARPDRHRFEPADEMVRRAGVPVSYAAVAPATDPVRAALRHAERLAPDLLVTEFGAQALRGEGAPDARRALSGSRGRLVASLLAWVAVDVAIVLDAVRVASPRPGAPDRGPERRARLAALVDGVLAGYETTR